MMVRRARSDADVGRNLAEAQSCKSLLCELRVRRLEQCVDEISVMVARRCHSSELDVTWVVQQAVTEQRSDARQGAAALVPPCALMLWHAARVEIGRRSNIDDAKPCCVVRAEELHRLPANRAGALVAARAPGRALCGKTPTQAYTCDACWCRRCAQRNPRGTRPNVGGAVALEAVPEPVRGRPADVHTKPGRYPGYVVWFGCPQKSGDSLAILWGLGTVPLPELESEGEEY